MEAVCFYKRPSFMLFRQLIGTPSNKRRKFTFIKIKTTDSYLEIISGCTSHSPISGSRDCQINTKPCPISGYSLYERFNRFSQFFHHFILVYGNHNGFQWFRLCFIVNRKILYHSTCQLLLPLFDFL